MDRRLLVVFGTIFIVITLGIIIFLLLGTREYINETEQEKERVIEEDFSKEVVKVDEDEIVMSEDEKEIYEFLDGYNLTEEEEKTILKNREEKVIEPFEDDRLYVFYDREKPGSWALLEMVEEYVEDTGESYTIYHMNNEEGLVFGRIVLERLGFGYDYEDEYAVVLVQIKDGEIINTMNATNLNEKDLVR